MTDGCTPHAMMWVVSMPLLRRPRRARVTAALASGAVLCAALVGCGSTPDRADPTGVDELVIPTPSPDPADFARSIDNPWLPLTPGNRWAYRVTSEEGPATITVTVLDRPRVVAGVTTTVVRDVARAEDATVLEETLGWFAQDRAGNVWQFGEDTTSYDGRRPSKDVSWEAGVGGAMAGIAMLAEPRLGDGYLQAYDRGEAEDQATVIGFGVTQTVPAGTFRDLLETEESTPLEPGLVERRLYARGVGLVHQVLISGGNAVVELVEYAAG